MMTRAEFLSRMTAHMGFSETADAEASIQDVLSVLGERLSRLEAEALADDLPPELGRPLRLAHHGQTFGTDEFYVRVSRRGQISVGRAREEAIVACRVLAEAVGEDAIRRLCLELPREWTDLFTVPEPLGTAPAHLHPEHHTLAEGHGGGSRPLYGARPDRSQSESVAASENPHGETKLSSTTGLTQEREEETLASGRPGSERPLSEADTGPTR